MRKYSEVFQEVFVSFSSSSGCAVDWHVCLHYCVRSRGWDTGNTSRRGHSHIACKCKHLSATELFVACSWPVDYNGRLLLLSILASLGTKAWYCQSRVLSDQVLLGIPRTEGEMFNIRFSYWEILDVTQDFKLREVIQILIQAQHRSYNLRLDHSTNMIPVTCLCVLAVMTLGVPSC